MYEMASLHFYIEKRNVSEKVITTRECPLILSYSYSAQRIKIYTGKKIRESAWDKFSERAKPEYANSVELNQYVERITMRIQKLFSEFLMVNGHPDATLLRKEFKRIVKLNTYDFFELLLLFFEENSKTWSLSTYKKMKTFYTQLKEFSTGQTEILTPVMINQVFADKLVEYYRRKGLKDSTISKNLDLLKWFMNWGVRRRYIINRDYETIHFTIENKKEQYNDYYLQWDELTRFLVCNELNRKEEWCRDIFCFIAFTGVRFSKLGQLKKENVSERYLQFSKAKNGKVLLNSFSSGICKKYENRFYRNNSLFPPLTLITFLKYLKSGAKKTGMKRILYPSKTDFFPVPLYQIICAQTAINSFFAHAERMDISKESVKTSNSAYSRIRILSGAAKFAEEKHLSTSEHLYESIRNTGISPS